MTLTLYSRPQCHLCDVMLDELTPMVEGKACIQLVDISEDDELQAEYGLRIPVLKAGEVELSRYHLDVARVREFVLGAAEV